MKIKNSVLKIGKGILLLSLMGTSAFAAEKYTKVDRIKDMITLADAMGEIQKGILFRNDNNKMVLSGIEKIRKVMYTIEKVEPQDFLDGEQLYAKKFAKKTGLLLEMYLDEMEDEARRGNPDKVLHNYALALRQCTSCHLRLRK